MFFWHRIMSVRTALVRLNAFTYVVQRLELATGLFKHHSGKYHLRVFFQFRPLFSHDNLHISALDKLISFIPFLKVYVFFPLLSHVPSALVANIFVFFVTHENLIKTYLIFILSCLILCYLHVLQTIKYSLAARPIRRHANHWTHWNLSQIAKFMGSTWGPPGTCRPQMGPMLAPWTLLSGTSRDGANSVVTGGTVVCHYDTSFVIHEIQYIPKNMHLICVLIVM